MRKTILLAALALAVPAAASAKQGPPPLASTWAPGVEISYTETVTDGLGNVVSQVHRGGIPAGAAFGIPFALLPLVRLTGNRALMGVDVNHRVTTAIGWVIGTLISLLNVVLIYLTVSAKG